MKKKLLVTVNHFGRIPPLYQDGPVLHPIWVDVHTAHTLVTCHYKVFEHNPNKLSEKIQLTLENVSKDNFPPFIPVVNPDIHKNQHDAGTPVEITKSVELPKPDRVKETSEVVQTLEKQDSEVSSTESSEKEISQESEITSVSDSVVEQEVSTESVNTENEKPAAQMSLTERAEALGIDTTGLSRNKIRAAIREKEAQK